jgi:hypothetical protein
MKKKTLPLDLYILFFIFFLHLLLALSNLTRPYYVLLGIFYEGLGTSIAFLYSEALLVIVIAFLYLRRIKWAKQIGIVFYVLLLANTVLSFIPAVFLRVELGSYLGQVITQGNLFQIYIVNLFAKVLIYVFAILSIKKNEKFLRF